MSASDRLLPKESNRVIFSVHENRGNMSLDVVYSAAIDPTGDPGADFRELASAPSIRSMDLALNSDMLFMLEPGSLTYMPSKGGPKKPIPYSRESKLMKRLNVRRFSTKPGALCATAFTMRKCTVSTGRKSARNIVQCSITSWIKMTLSIS